MNSEDNAASTHTRQHGIKDPKLLLGILLILASVVCVVAVIQITNPSKEYYAAKEDIHIGDKISAEQLTPVAANIGSASGNYLTADEVKNGNLVATRLILAGELVTKNSAANELRENRRLVTITIDRGASTMVKAGDHVDVWTAQRGAKRTGKSATSDENTSSESAKKSNTAVLAVKDAEISAISKDEGFLGANGKATVQIWVNPDYVSNVVDINATNANNITITLVPVVTSGEKK